ncbi:MAG: DUF3800 domain-containing protein [Muribaculaceae bacterium]|nr:DUF3800 domain-containing protein [Muribaculaceae bacterium]
MATKNYDESKYYLYIDECGDHQLEKFNPNFPVFTLCGVLIPGNQLKKLEDDVNSFKREFFNNEKVIIHSRDIRKQEKEYSILQYPETRNRFYEAINKILGQDGVYIIVCCSILKEPFIEKFSCGEDVYGLSLKYLIERSIFCMDDKIKDGTIEIYIERRGIKQDRTLLNYYNRLRATGTKWVTSERLVSRLGRFIFSHKKDNIIGLQLADLIAYPITRHVLNPKAPNPAYEIIKDKIYTYKGAVLGMKIIPH